MRKKQRAGRLRSRVEVFAPSACCAWEEIRIEYRREVGQRGRELDNAQPQTRGHCSSALPRAAIPDSGTSIPPFSAHRPPPTTTTPRHLCSIEACWPPNQASTFPPGTCTHLHLPSRRSTAPIWLPTGPSFNIPSLWAPGSEVCISSSQSPVLSITELFSCRRNEEIHRSNFIGKCVI